MTVFPTYTHPEEEKTQIFLSHPSMDTKSLKEIINKCPYLHTGQHTKVSRGKTEKTNKES